MATRRPKKSKVALPEGLEWLATSPLDPGAVEKHLVAMLRRWDERNWWPTFNVALLLRALAPKTAVKEAARLRDGREIDDGSDEDSAPWLAVALVLGDDDVREANDSGSIGPLPGDLSAGNSAAAEVGAWLSARVDVLTPKQAEQWLKVTQSKLLRDAVMKVRKFSSLHGSLAESGAAVAPAARKALPPLARLAAQATAKQALRGAEAEALANALVPVLVREARSWRGCMPWRWPTPLDSEMLDYRLRARSAQLAQVLPEQGGAVLRAVAAKLGASFITEAVQAELGRRGWFDPEGAEDFNESKLLTLASLMPAAFSDAVARRAQRDGFFRGLFVSSSLANHKELRKAASVARAAMVPPARGG